LRGRKEIITNKQKEWLLSLPDNPADYPKEYKLYMERIQKQINKNIELSLWLAKNRPDVFLNQVVGMVRMDQPQHQRFQQLLMLVQILKPNLKVYVELAKQIKQMETNNKFP